MADPRFYSVEGPYTLAQLAEIAEARISGDAERDRRFGDVAPLTAAGADAVSFLDNPRYLDNFARSKAGACLVHPRHAHRAPPGMALLLTETPYHAYARIARAFHPASEHPPGVHARATIADSASLGAYCMVEAGAVIGERVAIGDRCRIGPNAVVDAGVVIGNDSSVGACASLAYCIVGERVTIHPGVRIGQDGFGFAVGAERHEKVPQLGRVVIHDDVEIGANTTIDRGSGPDTVIGPGCIIDNLVQIGHNVELGRGCIVVAQVGISGSSRLGDFVMAGGQAGIAGHVTIGDGVKVAAQSGVMRDLEAGRAYGGTPCVPVRDWHRQTAALGRLARQRSE